MADPVQFKGIARTVKAYEMNNAANWSLWCGKNFLTKYTGGDIVEGAETLRVFLTNLSEDGSEATYTLRVYDEVKKSSSITSATPYDGSFAFKIFDDGMQSIGSSGRQTIFQVIGSLQDKIEALTERLNIQEEDPDEIQEEKPAGIIGAVNKLLDNPQIQAAIGAKLVGFLDKLFPGFSAAPAGVGKISGTPDSENIDKVNRALQVLFETDPDLGDHLLKLASIAKEKPQQFSMLIQMLNNF